MISYSKLSKYYDLKNVQKLVTNDSLEVVKTKRIQSYLGQQLGYDDVIIKTIKGTEFHLNQLEQFLSFLPEIFTGIFAYYRAQSNLAVNIEAFSINPRRDEVSNSLFIDQIIVMEHFGQDLSKDLKDGKWSGENAEKLLRFLIRSLKMFSQRGIIHGDLKPANVVRDQKYNFKLIDFDNSGFYRSGDDSTFRGHTKLYSSPEIIKNTDYKSITSEEWRRNDLHCAAVTLIQVILGISNATLRELRNNEAEGKIIFQNKLIESLLETFPRIGEKMTQVLRKMFAGDQIQDIAKLYDNNFSIPNKLPLLAHEDFRTNQNPTLEEKVNNLIKEKIRDPSISDLMTMLVRNSDLAAVEEKLLAFPPEPENECLSMYGLPFIQMEDCMPLEQLEGYLAANPPTTRPSTSRKTFDKSLMEQSSKFDVEPNFAKKQLVLSPQSAKENTAKKSVKKVDQTRTRSEAGCLKKLFCCWFSKSKKQKQEPKKTAVDVGVGTEVEEIKIEFNKEKKLEIAETEHSLPKVKRKIGWRNCQEDIEVICRSIQNALTDLSSSINLELEFKGADLIEDHWDQLARSCLPTRIPHLSDLSINASMCYHLKDRSVLLLSSSIRPFSSLSSLHLNLSGNRDNISDDAISTLVHELGGFTKLNSLVLNFANLWRVGHETANALARSLRNLTSITHLSLNLGWTMIDDPDLITIFEGFNTLTQLSILELYLDGCLKITDISFVRLADTISRLDSLSKLNLDAWGCIHVGDMALTNVFLANKSISSLYLDFRNTKITGKAINLILRHLYRLYQLKSFTNKINKGLLQKIPFMNILKHTSTRKFEHFEISS